ncbi:MAG: DUF5710 domain-containing protein, partial [Proteobacteria bacterium]|nr:DUF5710 domain-containing protein [Pseudomonadota bacterium]
MFSFFRSKNVSDKVNYGLGNVDEVAKQNIPLSVPFSQKDDAKLLGAKWNPTLKRWFIPKGAKVSKFDKWKMIFNDDLINPPIYLSSSNTKCWKCSKQTRVFSLAAEHIVNLDKIEYIDSGL